MQAAAIRPRDGSSPSRRGDLGAAVGKRLAKIATHVRRGARRDPVGQRAPVDDRAPSAIRSKRGIAHQSCASASRFKP